MLSPRPARCVMANCTMMPLIGALSPEASFSQSVAEVPSTSSGRIEESVDARSRSNQKHEEISSRPRSDTSVNLSSLRERLGL